MIEMKNRWTDELMNWWIDDSFAFIFLDKLINWFSGISEDTTEKDLKKVFAQFGTIIDCKVSEGSVIL